MTVTICVSVNDEEGVLIALACADSLYSRFDRFLFRIYLCTLPSWFEFVRTESNVNPRCWKQTQNLRRKAVEQVKKSLSLNNRTGIKQFVNSSM